MLERNGQLNVESVFPIILPDSGNEIRVDFPTQLKCAIKNRKACAATDAAMNDCRMGGHWIIMDVESKMKKCNTLHHNRWGDNTNKGAKAIALLDLMTVIRNKGIGVN